MKFGIRELLFVALMLGLLGSTYHFVYTKKDAERREMEAETARKQAQLAQLRQTHATIDDLGRRIDDLQKAIAFFESRLPQEKEMEKVLQEVSQMAEANSLQTRTIKTLRTERASHFSEQPIQMSLSGDFYGFYAFLQQLERLPRITRVTQMNLTKINSRDGEMEAQLTLSIFFEPETGGTRVATVH